jgi:hypothetical protein
MQGLVWSWLRDRDRDPENPEPVDRWASELARFDLATRAWHRRLWDTLASARARLTGLSLDAATMKGVTTEARWYRRVGERPCLDVDLLLAPGSARRADEILDALEPGHELRGSIVELLTTGAMQSVDVEIDGVRVDVHFDLFKLGIPARQPDVLWEHTEPLPLSDGDAVRVPDAETALLHALLHANKDGFPRLLGLADVARILCASDLDWGFIDRFVRAEGLEVPAYRSLETVTRLLRLPTPARSGWGARSAIWSIFWREGTILGAGGGGARDRRQDVIPFLARGRSGDALRWSRWVVLPPPVVLRRRYPDVSGPYLWRVARGKVRAARERNVRRRLAENNVVSRAGPRPSDDPDLVARLLRTAARNDPIELSATGTSMGWSIRDGSIVVVEEARAPRRGEVWAFCDDAGRVVVHRVRHSGVDVVVLQGDRAVHPDAPVSTGRLIGRVRDVRCPSRPVPRVRWGRVAGAVQRVPREVSATLVRAIRRAVPTC